MNTKNLEKYAEWNICGNRIKDLKRVLSELGLDKQWFRRKFLGEGIEVTYRLERVKEYPRSIDDFINPKVFVGTNASLFAESADKALPVYHIINKYLGMLQETQETIHPYLEDRAATGFRCITPFIGLK